MGEAAEDILEGRVCECCGEWMEGFLDETHPNGYGYPVTCETCRK